MTSHTTPPLKEVAGKNSYCGPAVVSAITGASTDEVARLIRCVTGRRAVFGTSHDELEYALMKLGFGMAWHERFKKAERPTLAKWLRERENRTATYIVHVTGHWVVVRGNKFADSRQRAPVFIRQAKGRRARVITVYEVWKR